MKHIPKIYLDNFLQRFVAAEDPARLRTLLSELHGHYSGTKEKEAQHKFIEVG